MPTIPLTPFTSIAAIPHLHKKIFSLIAIYIYAPGVPSGRFYNNFELPAMDIAKIVSLFSIWLNSKYFDFGFPQNVNYL
jgi:hypothetical protein